MAYGLIFLGGVIIGAGAEMLRLRPDPAYLLIIIGLALFALADLVGGSS